MQTPNYEGSAAASVVRGGGGSSVLMAQSLESLFDSPNVAPSVRAPRTVQMTLGGHPVTATPLGPPGSNGQTLYEVQWRGVTVQTAFTGQIGPAQFANGSPLKRQLEQAFRATVTQQSAPSDASFYKPGDRIGTPEGELTYVGRKADGKVYVQSSTSLYEVPANLRTKDEIRAWAIRAVTSNSINTPLYNPTSPANVATITYTAIGLNRPLSNLGNLGKSGLQAALNRFPGASKVLMPLLKLLPTASKPGESDILRVEVNTSLSDKSSVLHIKLNLAQLVQLAKPTTDQIFERALAAAPTAQDRAQVLFIKRMVDNGRTQSEFSKSDFAKRTDLRITFDPVEPNGFRLGLLNIPAVIQAGNSGIVGAFAVSPRVKFDAAGKPAGFQLLAGFELDSPSTKSGAWAGVGAGVLLEWNGGINRSPIRKNNAGQLGVEINVNGQQQFMRVPGLAGIVKNYGMGDLADVRLSKAPEITARDIAKNVLKTDDPKVIASIENAAKQAEKTGQIVDTAVNAAGTVSQIASVGAVVSGISVAGIIAAAALSVPIWAALQEPVSDGTFEGQRNRLYANDVKAAKAALDVAAPLLQKSGALSRDERYALNTALSTVREVSKKWFTNPVLNAHYNKLPEKERFPFTPAHVKFLEQEAKKHA